MTTTRSRPSTLVITCTAVSLVATVAMSGCAPSEDSAQATRSTVTVTAAQPPATSSAAASATTRPAPSSTTTPPSPSASSAPENLEEPGPADDDTNKNIAKAARAGITAYGDTKGKTPIEWRRSLRPYLSREAEGMFERMPPGPQMSVKQVGVGDVADGAAIAYVQTDGDRLEVQMVWEDEAWKIDLIYPTSDPMPANAGKDA